MKLEVNGMWSINNANIDIGKINIIGGNNSTGKSTTSKLLYCFIKSSTENGRNLAIQDITKEIKRFLRSVKNFFGQETYEEMKRDVEPITLPFAHPTMKENVTIEEVSDVYDNLIDSLRRGLSRLEISKNQYDGLKEIKLQNIKHKNEFLLNEGVDITYNDSTSNRAKGLVDIVRDFVGVGAIISTAKNDPFKIYEVAMKKLFQAEFNITKFNDPETYVKWYGDGFSYCLHNDKENKEFALTAEGEYEFKNVYYLDSFSILDTKMERIVTEHTDSLNKDIQSINLESNDDFDEEFDQKTKEIERKINEILHGKIEYEDNLYKYYFENRVSSSMINTASGIKQIGIIQLLLSKHKLKDGSFFIIDEPEVNLHPEWQFKLAEILVILAKNANITLYINSHSPIFIESIDAFAEYYDMEEEINYYLTEESEVKYKYNFTKVESNELYRVYANLGNVYKLVDQLRLNKRLERD